MEIAAHITVPEYVYRFYADASSCILERSPEEVMADALAAYAGMLSAEIAKQNRSSGTEEAFP